MKVIDISAWQKGLDISTTGADGVICKATQGTSWVDPTCDAHYQQAKGLGLALGVYHYASGGDPIAEADFFLKNIEGYIGEAILALDWEKNQNPRYYEYASWCLPFLKRVEERTGVKPLIYMSASVIKEADWSSVVANDNGLWVAGYPDNRATWDIPDFPFNISPWEFYALWQYTSSGGKLDRNVFNGDRKAWEKYASKSGTDNSSTAPAPAPAPSRKSVEELAREVIEGRWGNGQERRDRLTAEGYDYDAVQNRVNELVGIHQPSYYTVQPGDTLWGISMKYGVTVAQLVEWNGISNPSIIFPGQVLVVG